MTQYWRDQSGVTILQTASGYFSDRQRRFRRDSLWF
jgi:hypothetical protein